MGSALRLPEIGDVIDFTSRLEFPDQDKNQFDWLAHPTRHYRITEQLDQGGFAIPYLGYPCDANGVRISRTDVVLKFPNIGSADTYTQRQRSDRLHYLDEHAMMEWKHVRRRLLGCKHANPILDCDSQMLGEQFCTVTCQLFLADCLSLDAWLVKSHLRPTIRRAADGSVMADWNGISLFADWHKVALWLGAAVSAIHRHRVIHGDIWPPNIYVCNDDSGFIKLIDFNESAFFTPSGSILRQSDHPYRAPEQGSGDYVATEQVDVYSFGILLLYLAIGVATSIPKDLWGHARRRMVREAMFDRNASLVGRHPQILDIIVRCTAYDPVDRPSVASVTRELGDYFGSPSLPRPAVMIARDTAIRKRYESLFRDERQVMRKIVDMKIHEIETLLDSLETEMVEVYGSRDQLIDVLVALMGELTAGAAWTVITTPSVWQANALGLDGRVTTATVLAARRGAAINRGFVVSIEELGEGWTAKLIGELARSETSDQVKRLADVFLDRLQEYRSLCQQPHYRRPADEIILDRRRRFLYVLSSLRDLVSTWGCGEQVSRGSFDKITNSRGLFLGIVPVASVQDVRLIKRENPVALMYRENRDRPDDEWLLIMSDLRGRSTQLDEVQIPIIRGIRVYRSVMGVPHDRILGIETVLRDSAINVGADIELVADIAERLSAQDPE